MNTIKTMLAAAIAVCMSVPAHADEKRPNIIFIMADDLGNADLGYRGGQIQIAEHRQARAGGCPARVVLWSTSVHAVTGGVDDRPLSHALWIADAGDLSGPQLRSADRRAHAAAGAEGGRLQNADDRQMASRPCGQEVLAAKSGLRSFLRECHGRGGTISPASVAA